MNTGFPLWKAEAAKRPAIQAPLLSCENKECVTICRWCSFRKGSIHIPSLIDSFVSWRWTFILDHFISGGVALSTAFAVMHPLDTFKTRVQAGSSSSLWNLLASKESLSILRKGFFTSVLGAGPQGGLRLATYELAKSHILVSSHSSSKSSFAYFQTTNTMVASALCAIMGDFVSSIVKVPREVVTAR